MTNIEPLDDAQHQIKCTIADLDEIETELAVEKK